MKPTKDLSLQDPLFFQKAFAALVDAPPTSFIDNPYEPISSQMDETAIQDSASFRSLQRAYHIANILIDEEGVMAMETLKQLLQQLEQKPYSIGPNREMDALYIEHQINALKKLAQDKMVRNQLFRIDKPERNPIAEQLIRRATQKPSKAGLTKADARRAALSSWLHLLRQNVGSCFATAPALILQQEFPGALLEDLDHLFATGQLKRVVAGQEQTVPLCQTPGIGDLRRQIFIPPTSSSFFQTLGKSPGIQVAFEAMGIVADFSQLLEKSLHQHQTKVLTIEEVLKYCLLNHLNISEKEIVEYRQRPKPMVYSSLLMIAEKSTSITSVYEDFFLKLEQGKSAFCDLTDHPVLKAWEFTLASFAESQSTFATWNLYASLGMDPHEKGGLGFCMYQTIQGILQSANQKMESLQDEYKTAWLQLQGVESKVRQAESEQQLRWIRSDYLSKKNEFYTLEELRNKEHRRGQKLAQLFNFLVDRCLHFFPKYFQEVYDPDLHEIQVGPYDDAPAGFRLMYKHGRTLSSQWSFVTNYQEFTSSLTAFFTAFENELSRLDELVGLEEDLSQVITDISIHINTKEFIDTAFYRMAKAHNQPAYKNPLEHLDKIEKKPWAYTSGGTMASLVSNYFGKEEKPLDATTWVESPMELLIWLVDRVKQLPYKETDQLLHFPEKTLLIHSPTHAFRLKPALHPFKRAWEEKVYTYTFCRDYFLAPRKKFIKTFRLDQEMVLSLLQQLQHLLPKEQEGAFNTQFKNYPKNVSCKEFREYFLNASQTNTLLSPYFTPERVDALIYTNTPFTRSYQLEEILQALFNTIDTSYTSKALSWAKKIENRPPVLGARLVFSLCQLALSEVFETTYFSFSPHKLILEVLEAREWIPPLPILFADSNWNKDYFGFIVSPATEKLELWRLTPYSLEGYPLSSWEPYLNGQTKKPPWGIYWNRPDYTPS